MNTVYQWQGEDVSVSFGYVYQNENLDKPSYWYNFECNNTRELDGTYKPNTILHTNGKRVALLPAVQVSYKSEKPFLIANHYGIGVHKLINGGWPNYAHFSLNGEFVTDAAPYFEIRQFDIRGYETHEAARKAWQKKTYPNEFAKSEALRASMRTFMKNVVK